MPNLVLGMAKPRSWHPAPLCADLSACLEHYAGEDAAQVYRRLTDLHLKLDSRTDSAAAWVEASRAYTKAGNSTGAFDASVILQWH
jgi:hypothetical protein